MKFNICNTLRLLVFLVTAFVGLSAKPLAKDVDFFADIAPILETHCCHCHGEDEQESGLRLDRRVNLLLGGDSGLAAIVPGEPSKSYLMEVIRHVDEDMAMPPDDEKLSQEKIGLLASWIQQGAIWPGQMDPVSREKSDHWSFQPVERPEVPETSEQNGHTEDPISAFLRERLSSVGLSFSEPADPRSLIRRTSIVLTGIAPTPEEISEFHRDYLEDSERAYSALVERLLASQHFGERWAQHWLDVIRWAETNGSESNLYRKNAWIYRDYVIRAFNEDKPYNQFLREQIAGDLLGHGDATGYLVAGPHVPLATVGQEPPARRQARADRIDEILQTIGASALGLTIGCARCHNHKFDPISITDYYSLAAVFQDIEFGSRIPELGATHQSKIRGQELANRIAQQRRQLRKLGSWEEDWIGFKEIHFPSTTALGVRITFEPQTIRIDELEICGVKESENDLAFASRGTKVTSSQEGSISRFPVTNINDGVFGSDSWMVRPPKDSNAKPWVQFTFDGPKQLSCIRLSTNREEFFQTDYLSSMNKMGFGDYRVEFLDDKGHWRKIAATNDYDDLDQEYSVRPNHLRDLHYLIGAISQQGPQTSFVARFVEPAKTYVLGRGSPENPRQEVFPSGLAELNGKLAVDPYAPGPLRRQAFAAWVTKREHPLTARVVVNRLWHHVFGQGIVTTTSDFGAAGTLPTHPELLDWLAAELVQPSVSRGDLKPHPWSMKHLLRLMVMSQAFRQSSLSNEKGLSLDSYSALLWRYPPKRVEAEVIRDSILQASGVLDRTTGGPSYRIHNVKEKYAQWEVTDNFDPRTWRRMIYQERMRRVDDEMFTAFDFPGCGQVLAKRPVSTTPLQALNLLNSKFVLDQSQRIADRAFKHSGGNMTQSIVRCFQLLLGRDPTLSERSDALLLTNSGDLSLVCRALINSNEFAFLP